MSDPVPPEVDPDHLPEVPATGPSLPLFYSLIAFALVAAIALALMIVIPFHHRH